ncbi:MAG: hypothetical protein ACTS8S_01530 [Giesbergeria sp.]
MNRVLAWVLRAVVLVAGLVVFLSLLTAVLVLACLWGLRMLWARITGRPVTPWVMGVDPRAAWRATASRTGWGQRPAEKQEEHEPTTPPQTGAAGPLMRPLPGTEDVTDVQPRAPRD